MMASKRKESVDQKNEAERKNRHPSSRQESLSVGSSEKSFVETQADIFNHRHGLLILHLLAALMFVPSLAAWFQVLTPSTFLVHNYQIRKLIYSN